MALKLRKIYCIIKRFFIRATCQHKGDKLSVIYTSNSIVFCSECGLFIKIVKHNGVKEEHVWVKSEYHLAKENSFELERRIKSSNSRG